jgi:hypothetical protein
LNLGGKRLISPTSLTPLAKPLRESVENIGYNKSRGHQRATWGEVEHYGRFLEHDVFYGRPLEHNLLYGRPLEHDLLYGRPL